MGLFTWAKEFFEALNILVFVCFRTDRGRDVRVVLLDSEGTECAEAAGQQDNQIFTFDSVNGFYANLQFEGSPKEKWPQSTGVSF